jgi:hypothetical protein
MKASKQFEELKHQNDGVILSIQLFYEFVPLLKNVLELAIDHFTARRLWSLACAR